jgi:hypothetical protein
VHFYYYRVVPGEMELRCKGISVTAEGILHRLMRVYFNREREIQASPRRIAALVGADEGTVQDCWEELVEVVDLGGSEVRIPWFDAEVEKQRDRIGQCRDAVNKRWHGGKR